MRYYPDKKGFLALARKGNLIPVYTELLADFETPLSAFTKIGDDPYAFLLESVEGGERIARYSFLGSAPSLVFSSKGKMVTVSESGRSKSFMTTDPINELKTILSRYRYVKAKGLPRFAGGMVGFFGYDIVRFIEEIPDRGNDDLKTPDSLSMLTDTMLVFDHVDRRIKIISNAHIKASASDAYDDAVKKIEALSATLRNPPPEAAARGRFSDRSGCIKPKSNFTKAGFESAVRRAKAYIRKGDAVQVVLSQRLEIPVRSEPFDIYRSLRSINPSPYMYYLKLGGFYLVGSSPEIMVRCEDGVVELRPIAGTRRRGSSEAEDESLIKGLLADPKERAEHIMLVDLGRNDIGRVCDYNSVKVSDLMTIEKYSHVMHIVTDVSGRLKKGKDSFDVMRAAFPAGTVSGAPKVRAMQIIDELEKTRRGTYAGCVGYFSFSGNLDSCITIRTILIKNAMAYIQVGAGIVADSVPAREYRETINKSKALVKAIEASEGGLDI
jgi:anthranilate synthase component 1